MDTHKLYGWEKKQEDNNIIIQDNEIKQEQDQLSAQQQKQLLDTGKEAFDSKEAGADVQNDIIMDKRPEVFDHMPPTVEVFSRKQELVRSGKYVFLSKKGEVLKGTRNTPSKKYMAPILDNLKRLDTLLAGKFDPANEEEIQNCFKDTILSCEKYIANRNPWSSEGKARLQMVKDFMAQVQHESIRFAGKVQELTQNPEEVSKDKTWLSVLSDVRTLSIENNKDGYKITEGGAGTSKVYIIEKDGKKQFFKQNEKLPNGSLYGSMGDEIKALNKNEDEISKRRAEYLTVIKDSVMKHFDSERMANHQFSENQKGGILLYLRAALSKDKKFVEVFNKMFAEVEKNRKVEGSDFEFVEEKLVQAKKNHTLHAIATKDAMIKDGSEISKRNVATSRMAKLLGVEDMVAKSTATEITINGKKMSGIAMEEAKGKITSDVGKEAERKDRVARYSPNAFRQLLNLQIFDIICGQVDRNASNYICQYAEDENSDVTEITEIKAIDNDICFGNLKYKDIFEWGSVGLNRMRNIENLNGINVPCIDKEFADRILAVEPKQIDYLLCDILTKEEREAAIDRLKGVQKAIRKRMDLENKRRAKKQKVNSVFVRNEEGKDNWDDAYYAFTEKVAALKSQEEKELSTYRAILNDPTQFEDYTSEIAEFEKQNLKDRIRKLEDKTDNTILSMTYLHGNYISG